VSVVAVLVQSEQGGVATCILYYIISPVIIVPVTFPLKIPTSSKSPAVVSIFDASAT